jgi:ribosomal protein S12 methylthiotransferase accessory factor
MDRLGIPVFITKRIEDSTGGQKIHNGKGFSPVESTVSAMMESIERYCSNFTFENITISPLSKMNGRYTDPYLLSPPQNMYLNESMPLLWCPGFSLMGIEYAQVLANAVFHPFPQNQGWLFRSNTNGLACGNCLEEAILHALCEVIERDAWSLAELTKDVSPDLEVDVSDAQISWLLDRFNDAEIDLWIKDITSDLGIPTFFAASDDIKEKDPTLLNMGVGTHLSPKVALVRALTELAQSRLSQIYQNNIDPSSAIIKRRLGYERIKRMNKRWFTTTNKRKFSEFQHLDTPYLLDDIELLVKRLSESSLKDVYVVDLTRESIGIPVVRVVVPGLEQYCVDRDRVGNRARTLLYKGV